MSDEETEATDETAGEIKEEDKPETKPAPKDLPEDQEWDNTVEFSPEQQKRFNRLYAEVKTSQAAMQRMGEDNRKLLERLEELESSQTKTTLESKIAEVKKARKEAIESGDMDSFDRLDEELANLRLEGIKPKENKPETDGLTADQQQRITEWSMELDENGEPKRPWADPSHPQNRIIVAHAAALREEPQWKSATVDQFLAELDRQVPALLGEQKPTRSTAPVLPGQNLKVSKKKESSKLSRDEEAIAGVMFPDLPKAEQMKRYLSAQSKIEGNRRVASK